MTKSIYGLKDLSKIIFLRLLNKKTKTFKNILKVIKILMIIISLQNQSLIYLSNIFIKTHNFSRKLLIFGFYQDPEELGNT